MKMQEPIFTVYEFDANDIIMTSGGGEESGIDTQVKAMWLPYDTILGYNAQADAASQLDLSYKDPSTLAQGEPDNYAYYSYTGSYAYNSYIRKSLYTVDGKQDEYPSDGLYYTDYGKILDWLIAHKH